MALRCVAEGASKMSWSSVVMNKGVLTPATCNVAMRARPRSSFGVEGFRPVARPKS